MIRKPHTDFFPMPVAKRGWAWERVRLCNGGLIKQFFRFPLKPPINRGLSYFGAKTVEEWAFRPALRCKTMGFQPRCRADTPIMEFTLAVKV